ncbi:hypothetical protein [Brachybacterium huguangmaarense]
MTNDDALTRSGALALGAAAAVLAIVGRPAVARADTGSSAGRSAFAVPAATSSFALWGSSSMAGGLGDQGSPVPTYVHDLLVLAASPLPVHRHALGGTTSGYARIARGAASPVVMPTGSSGGPVPVQVRTPCPPTRGIAIPGTVGTVHGTLRADGTAWTFEADGQAAVPTGAFLSDWAGETHDSRHIVWTGKNNVTEVDRVLDDVEATRASARDPESDVLVLGMWAAAADVRGSATRTAIAEIVDHQRYAYGARFLDVQELLTGEAGLRSEAVAPLGLLEREDVRRDIAAGIVPSALVGADGKHLNGWGNLVVGTALLERARELAWL